MKAQIHQTTGVLKGYLLAALAGIVVGLGACAFLVTPIPPFILVTSNVLSLIFLYYGAVAESFGVNCFNQKELLRGYIESKLDEIEVKNPPKNSEKVGELKGDTDV